MNIKFWVTLLLATSTVGFVATSFNRSSNAEIISQAEITNFTKKQPYKPEYRPFIKAFKPQVIAQAITQESTTYMQSFSVKINSNNNTMGSAVIISKTTTEDKNDRSYLVITSKEVVEGVNNFTIQTADEKIHQAELDEYVIPPEVAEKFTDSIIPESILSNDNFALLRFSSKNNYDVAQLNTAARGIEEHDIFAIGYSAETGDFIVKEGTIKYMNSQPFKGGYQIGYSGDLVSGMSGGAILNTDRELIGINGKSTSLISQVYQDGTIPTVQETEQFRQLNWGISFNQILSHLNPIIITTYKLPLPVNISDVSNTSLRGWLEELEELAKQFTIKIESSSGNNGSGVIIAKEDSTYTVLTADHVICEQEEKTNNCIDYIYEIVTPDGQKHILDRSNFKRQEEVDLAVIKFSSNAAYEIAQLASYPLFIDDIVFVAGYPKIRQEESAQWRFSLGYSSDREQGLLNINNNVLSTDSFGAISSQGSLVKGYEMVYTSITYGGMSGGAVLDRDGRVIGIHGLAEGEEILDTNKKIQLGYSLGIFIRTFARLINKFEIDSSLPIQNSRPKKLNTIEQKAFLNTIFNNEIGQGNTTAEQWLQRGNQLWRLRRYNEAIQAFDEVINFNLESTRLEFQVYSGFIHLAYYGKGLVFLSQKQYRAALENMEIARVLQPDFEPARLVENNIKKKINQLDDEIIAIQTDKEIALRNDNNVNNGDNSLNIYNQAISLNPQDSNNYINRGVFYQNQGALELAVADFNHAISINPSDVLAYINRGILYKNQGELELALADFNQVILLEPNFPNAYIASAIVYLHMNDFKCAKSNLHKAQQLVAIGQGSVTLTPYIMYYLEQLP